ncbi:peptidase S10, serine carboxypeptidase, Alpha/Beta hydrolase fold protein [Artemisia annua]|uniref:Peptidase S10, serine carboxypeptidase, Alpha/Beta hydrolase fold protein n=1 Tax=Artemisia annua TaxID=35608 RepID=A0A2U1P584_ARTAN|nr:peptidase S10, serine carboxypeptidase, Alpha/Beta hydrolase fold protein [Artemisia annua]
MKIALLLPIYLCLLVSVHYYGANGYDTLERALRVKHLKRSLMDHATYNDHRDEYTYSPAYVGPQDGLKDADKISELPGQPDGTDFDQYSGYVTVDPDHGKALFYYLTESPINSSTNPLLLWLQGGMGCSSLGYGAMMELGPFRVNADHKTLSRNKYAWNNISNVLFLESPAGVGFSYSNMSETGDAIIANDSYAFLLNWLERFPEYKERDFYIAGEEYAAHYISQLAYSILQKNKIANQTVINIKGIALGNPLDDYGTSETGTYEYLLSHAIISDEIYEGIRSNCNFSYGGKRGSVCNYYRQQAKTLLSNIEQNDIYAPLCSPLANTTPSELDTGIPTFYFNIKLDLPHKISGFDPCSEIYIRGYLNTPAVQQSLHAKPVNSWEHCNWNLIENWTDMPFTVLPWIKDLMASGIRVWFYSGDTDAKCPFTSAKLSIKNLTTSVKTPWYPWMYEGEVGGYAVEYQNLTFVTIRGAGHTVPSYQPGRALEVYASFLEGTLP